MSASQRSRDRILDAADAAFREIGFAGVSMEEIARRAGLTRMTVYNLFATKENVAYWIAARHEAQSIPPYQARIARGEDAIRLLEEAFVDSARWCRANPSIAPIALAGPPGETRMEPPAGRPTFHGLVAELMALGQAQGSIRLDRNATVMAVILLGSFAQVMLFALSHGQIEDSAFAGLVRLSVEGFGARRPVESSPSPAPAPARSMKTP